MSDFETPTLEDFDIVHVGISGGKDSTGLLLWLIYESNIPPEKWDITICDTENEDPLTYAYVDMLRGMVERAAPGKTITVLQAEKGFWDLAYDRRRFPAARVRFCTTELKIFPTREYIRQLQRDGHNVALLSGVRREEGHSSNNRGSAELWEFELGFGAWVYRPLLHATMDDVWALHRKHISVEWVVAIITDDPRLSDEHKAELVEKMRADGLPRNPLYLMGATRVGCFPCINSKKLEVRAMARYRPERIDFIREQEVRVGERSPFGYVGFFHRLSVPEQFRRLEATGTTLRKPRTITLQMATIDDVVDWSRTLHGGRTYDLFADVDFPPAAACDIGGMCE